MHNTTFLGHLKSYLCNSLKLWSKTYTRSTPRREEIQQPRFVASKYFVMKFITWYFSDKGWKVLIRPDVQRLYISPAFVSAEKKRVILLCWERQRFSWIRLAAQEGTCSRVTRQRHFGNSSILSWLSLFNEKTILAIKDKILSLLWDAWITLAEIWASMKHDTE